MTLWLLFTDELRGFFRSRIMLFLWVGLPILVLLLRLLPADDDIGFTAISGVLVASIGGTLGSAMLAVSIINEKTGHVYDLFLIRPLPRRNLLLSKYLAVFGCITVASVIAHATGLTLDLITTGELPPNAISDLASSSVVTLSGLAVSCAAGLVIGVVTSSVLVGVILVIYGGNQLSGLPLMPVLLGVENNAELITIGLGIVLTFCLLVTAVLVFDRKEL